MIKEQRVLIDIDCLHDTRIALQQELFPKLEFDFKTYHTRTSDGYFIVKGADKDVWNKGWKERSHKLLASAKPTYMFFELAVMLRDRLTMKQLGTPVKAPTLTVNIYPYMMSSDEREIYKGILISFFGRYVTEINIIRRKPKKLTQVELTENFDMYICYDFYNWHLTNADGFKEKQCPSFTMVIPALFKYEYAKEAMDQIIKDKVNPFRELVDGYAELMTLEVMDASIFSLHPDYYPT